MLLNGNGSSGESCTKRSDGHSSGASSPHSDRNQSFNPQSKANMGYPSFPPPGTQIIIPFFLIFYFSRKRIDKKISLVFWRALYWLKSWSNSAFIWIYSANWTEFLPPPPEHPPPLPLANCAQPMTMCYVPTSPGSMRRVTAAPWPNTGIPNHQRWELNTMNKQTFPFLMESIQTNLVYEKVSCY